MNINRMIYGFILAKGLNITELSKKSGVARQTIHKIINGETLTTKTLEKLCKAMDLTISFEKIRKND